MRPYFYDYSHRPPYYFNVNTQPTFNNNQNWSRHGSQNVWSRGWSESQNQYNYRGPIPHYGWGMENGGCSYTPQQTGRPTIPVVAPQPRPLLRPRPQPRPQPQPTNHAVAPDQRPQPTNHVVAPEQRPQPTNPVVALEQPRPQPTNHVVAPEQWPQPHPTNPIVAPEQCPRPQRIMCRICGVRLSSERDKELHNNGKKHRKMLILLEESKKQKAINGQKSCQMPNSAMHLAVQPKTDNESNRNGNLVEIVSSESTVDKHKGCLKKNMGESSKVPANIPLQTARPSNPVVDPKQQPRPIIMCHICGVRLGSEKDMEQHNNGFRHRYMLKLLEGSDKQKGRNKGESGQMPDSLMDSVLQPKTVNKSKSKGCLVENARSESTPNKHKNYLKKNTEVTSKVSSKMRQGEPRDSFVAQGHSFKRKIGGDEFKEKGEGKRRCTESSKPDVSALSKCVESLVQEPAAAQPEGHVPLQEPVSALRSSFEPQNDQVLRSELEHHVSETISHNESLNPSDQANVQQPSLVAVEFDVPVNSNTSTETADGSFHAEEKMDVCTTEKWTAPLSQVNVCLKCGNEGFQETLVFCNKCNIYALHRYCLDGPVVFFEDVTWFCEDCEPAAAVVVESINNNKTCIKQAEENRQQQQQNIVAETKDQLHDGNNSFNHGLSQCSNEFDGENKVEKECQLVLNDAAANSCEETVSVENSPAAATSDGLNSVQLEGHAVAEPIIDPIWRGRFRLHNQGTGTFDGLLAHLSSLACCQVREETRLLTEELCVDLLERSEVWPNSFKKCCPDQDRIALYFFPENERAEKDFDELVDDMIQFDHAMRVVLEHAELLVFPSTLLPAQYRRFQAKYYLWGVFKAKKI